MAQLVEYDLAKVGVAGSSPVSRFFYLQWKPGFYQGSAVFLCSKKISFRVDRGRQLSLNGQKDGKLFVWQNGFTRFIRVCAVFCAVKRFFLE